MAFEDVNGREAYQFGSMAVSQAINASVNTDGNKHTCFAYMLCIHFRGRANTPLLLN